MPRRKTLNPPGASARTLLFLIPLMAATHLGASLAFLNKDWVGLAATMVLFVLAGWTIMVYEYPEG